MPRKKQKKSSFKTIHYVQLQTHRQWPNESTYLSHLEVYHSNIKPILYNIDQILNNKWINIRQPQIIDQLNDIYQEEIRNHFLHKTNLIDYKFVCLNNQFDENNQFLREILIRSIEIIDYLLYLYQQIENSERQIYEYRLNILKYEFEQEREAFKHLFIDQELKELDNQINVLNAMEQDHAFQQSIQFKLQKRQLEQNFFKDTALLHADFNTQIASLRSTINKTIRSNDQQINLTSKHCHYLHEKTRQGKERIDQEILSINILKRKIEETKKALDHIEINRIHLNDKLNQLKQCSNNHQNDLIPKKSLIKTSQQNQTQRNFRRLAVLIDNIQKTCRKKLFKAERLLLLINQCDRLELEDEKLLLSKSNIHLNEITNQILSQVHYLHNCQLEFDSFFDELSLFWKRFAHVQMDLFIRIEEKKSLKKFQKFYKNQLKILC